MAFLFITLEQLLNLANETGNEVPNMITCLLMVCHRELFLGEDPSAGHFVIAMSSLDIEIRFFISYNLEG